jgi:hypothetical protein
MGAPCGSRRLCSNVLESTGAIVYPALDAAGPATGPVRLRGLVHGPDVFVLLEPDPTSHRIGPAAPRPRPHQALLLEGLEEAIVDECATKRL